MEEPIDTSETKAPRLLERVREALRVRHLSIRTEKAYLLLAAEKSRANLVKPAVERHPGW